MQHPRAEHSGVWAQRTVRHPQAGCSSTASRDAARPAQLLRSVVMCVNVGSRSVVSALGWHVGCARCSPSRVRSAQRRSRRTGRRTLWSPTAGWRHGALYPRLRRRSRAGASSQRVRRPGSMPCRHRALLDGWSGAACGPRRVGGRRSRSVLPCWWRSWLVGGCWPGDPTRARCQVRPRCRLRPRQRRRVRTLRYGWLSTSSGRYVARACTGCRTDHASTTR